MAEIASDDISVSAAFKRFRFFELWKRIKVLPEKGHCDLLKELKLQKFN